VFVARTHRTTPPSKNIHGEGDEMRATQDNAQGKIHEEKEEMRATNAPAHTGQHPAGGNT
jgi:hypothetical protein